MKCEMRLLASDESGPCAGYFVFGNDPRVLSGFLSHFTRELPRIFPLSMGFLVQGNALMGPGTAAVLKLQGMGDRLFFPLNARLIPALMPDEVEGITGGKGLVILPHHAPIPFDPSRPMNPSDWIEMRATSGYGWAPFPQKAQTAKHLTRIERPSPPVAAIIELVGGAPDRSNPLSFQGGESGPVPEDARPPEASAWATIRGQWNLKGGQFLSWLGGMANIPGLSKMGADLAKTALENVPRLTEKLLGAQEAALREVLRQLQEGDIEKGLRRAPVAVSDPQSGSGKVGTGSRLGEQSPLYSLGKLLDFGTGQGVGWLGGGNVWDELAKEYRRLAMEATRRGDFRRAAYLYGFLLKDLRSAANALVSGGMFRDAALLYRDKLGDTLLAAATFEKAGELDEAVRLYLLLKKYEKAGELLERMGDEERAREMYLCQAEEFAGSGRYLIAGDLIAKKIGTLKLANRFFVRGWDANGPESRPCAERLLDHSASLGDWQGLQELTAQARKKKNILGYEETSRVINYALKKAQENFPEKMVIDFVDQAKSFFGSIVHEEAEISKKRGERAAEQAFHYQGIWSASVQRDALFASRGLHASVLSRAAHQTVVSLIKGPVLLAIISRQTRDLVLASDSQILVWRPDQGNMQPVVNHGSYGKVIGIATDPNASKIYVLTSVEISGPPSVPIEQGPGDPIHWPRHSNKFFLHLFAFRSGKSFHLATSVEIPGNGGTPWLQPETETGDIHSDRSPEGSKGEQVIFVDNAKERFQFNAFDLLQKKEIAAQGNGGLFFSANADPGSQWVWGPKRVKLYEWLQGKSKNYSSWSPQWFAYWETPENRQKMVFDSIFPGTRQLELAWIDISGNLHCNQFHVQDWSNPLSKHLIHSQDAGYNGVCQLGSGKMAALTRTGEIHWLKIVMDRFVDFSPRVIPEMDNPFRFIFARPHAEEVIVLCLDGCAIRVKIP